jgi:hypothetical protein
MENETGTLIESPILQNQPFKLTVEDINRARQSVDKKVQRLHEIDTSRFDRSGLKELRETVLHYEKQRELMGEGTESDILARLRQIYDRIGELTSVGKSNDEIGQIINDEFPDDFHRFHEMRRNGYAGWLTIFEHYWQKAEIKKLNERKKIKNRILRWFKNR